MNSSASRHWNEHLKCGKVWKAILSIFWNKWLPLTLSTSANTPSHACQTNRSRRSKVTASWKPGGGDEACSAWSIRRGCVARSHCPGDLWEPVGRLACQLVCGTISRWILANVHNYPWVTVLWQNMSWKNNNNRKSYDQAIHMQNGRLRHLNNILCR